MELPVDFIEILPQFKYLVDNPQLLNPMGHDVIQAKEDKLKDDVLPDLSAAYLGPQIWNKMMMSDDLKLEPVDLDELLNENIATVVDKDKNDDLAMLMCPTPSSDYNCQQNLAPPNAAKESCPAEGGENYYMFNPYPRADDSAGNVSVHSSPSYSTVTAQQICEPEAGFTYDNPLPSVNTITEPLPAPEVQPVFTAGTPPPETNHLDNVEEAQQENEGDDEVNAEGIRVPSPVECSYQPNITDVMISTPLDGEKESTELFDPRKRSFTDEELKPQPIIRKARKMYVSEERKDAKYWQKREKNNVAAKRSREARRIKENQIAMRANFLEKENSTLRSEVQALRKELNRLVEVVKIHEEKQGIVGN